MMDILDDLQADLDALRSLAIETRIADENTPHEADSFAALVGLFSSQTSAQETTLRPLIDRSPSLKAALQRSAERIVGASDVEAMIECCTNGVTWRSSVNIYCELIEKHISKLMMELLPAVYDNLAPKERSKLATAYRKLRGFEKPAAAYRTNWQKLWATVVNQTG